MIYIESDENGHYMYNHMEGLLFEDELPVNGRHIFQLTISHYENDKPRRIEILPGDDKWFLCAKAGWNKSKDWPLVRSESDAIRYLETGRK